MYQPHHFLSQIKQMNQCTSVPAKKSQKFSIMGVGSTDHFLR